MKRLRRRRPCVDGMHSGLVACVSNTLVCSHVGGCRCLFSKLVEYRFLAVSFSWCIFCLEDPSLKVRGTGSEAPGSRVEGLKSASSGFVNGGHDLTVQNAYIRTRFFSCVAQAPPWRQPQGKWMIVSVNSHTNATRIGWHLWEIDSRFAPGLTHSSKNAHPRRTTIEP